jgi:hypothetical protein
MEIRIEYISHEKAQELVEKSSFKPNDIEKVRLYKEIMEAGEWVNATEHCLFSKKHYAVPIIFTEDGILWEGKHRIHALAQSNVKGYKFVCIYGWDKTKATTEYQTGDNKFTRWGYLVYAMYQLSRNGNNPTELENL